MRATVSFILWTARGSSLRTGPTLGVEDGRPRLAKLKVLLKGVGLELKSCVTPKPYEEVKKTNLCRDMLI